MSNITPGHVRAFQAVRSQLYDNITLTSCTINGEPSVAIVMIDFASEDKVAVMPLFVAITNNMKLTFPSEGDSDGGGGGGPKNPARGLRSEQRSHPPGAALSRYAPPVRRRGLAAKGPPLAYVVLGIADA
jgi:hypothetical protein